MDNELYESLGILVEAGEQYADYLFDLMQGHENDVSHEAYEQFVNGIDGATMSVRQFLAKARNESVQFE